MPKKKEIIAVEPRPVSRRAASKEALKQMQRLSEQAAYDSPETLEIPSDDEEVIAIDPAPKKKYRLSHRKSSDGNDRDVIVLKTINYENNSLNLESWTEELSPAQLAMRNKAKKEIDDISSRLETLLSETTSQVVMEGDGTALYEFVQEIKQPPPAPVPAAPVVTPSTSHATRRQQAAKSQALKLVMDPRSGVVVGTMTPTTSAVPTPVTTPQTRKRTRGSANLSPAPTPAKVAKTTVAPTPPTPASTSTNSSSAVIQRATEATAIGGLSHGSAQKPAAAVVDLTTDDNRSTADSREISFNKLQGKTFPSLVVVARPHLKSKDVASDRGKLDAKVKAVLMHAPTKFTEWLIQVGVIRSEQTCTTHPQTKLKLGMYSDVTKFPFSGGYVWISECCPQRFVSVFSGSIFEGSPHPPSVILKLVYHWACQTNVQNVVQWVKVDNLYIKGVNTWLRATCTAALHTHVALLGGPGKKVEVGVISLGTTSQDGHQRQVKVEVLGLLESEAKLLRLRAVEPLADGDRNYKKRFSKILEPLVQWVHPESTIVTDLTVDKATLQSMGFRSVIQSTSADNINNHTIMEYLRRIVPRMFQNTLSLLSRQIIQQFLDELVWREWFGPSPAVAFDNIILHLSEQTKIDSLQNLVQRLNKIAGNPFKNWSIKHTIAQPPAILKTAIQPETPKRFVNKAKQRSVPSPAPETSRPPKSVSPDIPEQMVPLEHCYYGSIEGFDSKDDRTNLNVKCSMCKAQFTNNVKLMQHLFTHAHNVHAGAHQCRYCLATMTSKEILVKHIANAHPLDTKNGDNFICVICEGRFYNTYSLGKHMSREHVPSELPYQCGTCRFRCSSHKQVVDHFYTVHDGGSTMQCPFCLKPTSLMSNGRVLTQNLTHFLQHLQKHQKKSFPKKCPKCALWFVQKDLIKDHIQKMHSSLRRKAGLVPWPVPRYSIMVPKSRQEEPVEQRDINISKVIINDAKENLKCRECDSSLTIRNHFPSVLNCSNENCQYTTCCQIAMDAHVSQCVNFHLTLPVQLLPFKMFCVCGYSDLDGNSMAKHLAVCERKSAYPTEEAAKAATVTHSMLDVLGLVRRPEEPTTTTTDVMDVDEDDVASTHSASNNKPSAKVTKKKSRRADKKVSVSKTEGEQSDTKNDEDDANIKVSENNEQKDEDKEPSKDAQKYEDKEPSEDVQKDEGKELSEDVDKNEEKEPSEDVQKDEEASENIEKDKDEAMPTEDVQKDEEAHTQTSEDVRSDEDTRESSSKADDSMNVDAVDEAVTNDDTKVDDAAQSADITQSDSIETEDKENVIEENGINENSTDVEKITENDEPVEAMDVDCGTQMRNMSDSNELSLESMVQ